MCINDSRRKTFLIGCAIGALALGACTSAREVNEAASLKPAGAGLGLSLVRAFVEMHHGRVELQSKRNEGTTVTCRVPLRVAGVEVPVQAERPSSAGIPSAGAAAGQ